MMARLDPAALPTRVAGLDRAVTGALARVGIPVLRIGLGVVFLWFGALKVVPGLSPAEGLATRTIELISLGFVSPGLSLPLLAAVECFIGLGLLTGRFLRATLLVLAVQMVGTMTPLLLFPDQTFSRFPFVPTLEGQYIIKNVVLIGAAMVIGATVRGGRLVAEPPARIAVTVMPAGAMPERTDRASLEPTA